MIYSVDNTKPDFVCFSAENSKKKSVEKVAAHWYFASKTDERSKQETEDNRIVMMESRKALYTIKRKFGKNAVLKGTIKLGDDDE